MFVQRHKDTVHSEMIFLTKIELLFNGIAIKKEMDLLHGKYDIEIELLIIFKNFHI